ncbi:DUF3857 domain-containing protein [Aquimarina brevivitae]|uniref:Uncharacterized protein DUF3858 n=1 Tax=Aquimarina brevivitae TaxID=323412 RepID=A0A4Q7NXS8_9FLAO|nr:DUF3857 domain-containing protein [Aquimarina brevivitae]RZS92211.1 uncharacterized protein DUF3858 [Aquimarina brevivitae]
MNYKVLLQCAVCLFLYISSSYAQEFSDLQSIVLDSVLIQDANAVVRNEEIVVTIKSKNSVVITTSRTVTVLNRYGNDLIQAYESYDNSTKIKRIEATIHNSVGEEIKKIRKKDFIDVSAFDGFSLASDNRVKYLEYTPVEYPYTVSYTSEVELTNTAFITPWIPIADNKLSVNKSSYTIYNLSDSDWRFNEKNLDKFGVIKKAEDNKVAYSIQKSKAYAPEVYSLASRYVFPYVRVAMDQFTLAEVEGTASDWDNLGKWMYDKLLKGRSELPQETLDHVTKMVDTLTTKKEKVKSIYKYVQDKTRYVSIQLGIGGWMPFLASDVDRLGYGDCKALTNYTKALLSSQGIESYYSIVYADQEKQDIDTTFAAFDGNHVILNVPDGEDDIWLECTSQTMPYNFLGDFTDDRKVVLITPTGGKIKTTKKYTTEENILITQAEIEIFADKSMRASVTRKASGLEYDWNHNIIFQDQKDQKLHYQKLWNYINDLQVTEIDLKNDKDSIQFTEKLKINTTAYCKKAGSRILFTPNVFSRFTNSLPKYKDRISPLDISRGYTNEDTYVITMPDGYGIDNLPRAQTIRTQFGLYTYRIRKLSNNQLECYRKLILKDGLYPKEAYKEFRLFFEKIKNIDDTKIVLKKQ